MTHLTREVHILIVYEKSGGQQLHQYQQNDHLLPKTIQQKKRLRNMSLEIQILALSRHKNVAVSNPLPLDNCALYLLHYRAVMRAVITLVMLLNLSRHRVNQVNKQLYNANTMKILEDLTIEKLQNRLKLPRTKYLDMSRILLQDK